MAGQNRDFNTCGTQLGRHLGKLISASDAQSGHRDVVCAILDQTYAMVPIVHAQVAAIRLDALDDLKAKNMGGIMFPRRQIANPNGQVA